MNLFFYRVMYKISRKLWRQALCDTDAIKALALVVCIKNIYSDSLITNFSVNKVAKLIGKRHSTTKRLLVKLEQMKLISYHFEGEELRAVIGTIRNKKYKQANINIEKFSKSTFDNIVCGLKAMTIKEYIQRKEYLKQQAVQALNPKNKKEVKRRDKLLSAGVLERDVVDPSIVKNKFVDTGLSYRKIGEWIEGGYNSVSKIIKFGVECGLFVKEKSQSSIYSPMTAVDLALYGNMKCTFTTKNYIILVGANRYYNAKP